MAIALPAIMNVVRVTPPPSATRDPLPRRLPPKEWIAPNPIGRGQLIDLVV